MRPTVPLTSVEAQVQARLGPSLAPYEDLLGDCWKLVSASLAESNEVKLPLRGNVMVLLLTRLQGDLRVVHWAACTGYVVQALALAAGVQELAYQAVFAGQSDEEAERWARHDKHHQAYPVMPYRKLLGQVAPLLGYPQSWVEPHYTLYQRLCWAKHGNTLLTGNYGIQGGSPPTFLPSPHVGEKTAELARFAMLHSLRAVLDAVTFFGEHHLGDREDQLIVDLLTSIPSRIQDLGQRHGLLEYREMDSITVSPTDGDDNPEGQTD